MNGQRRGALRAVAPALLGLVAVLTAAAPGGAQEGPYGPTTSTSGPGRQATIELTVDSGARGSEVGVFACGYELGTTGGSVSFDGQVVATDLVANADGCLTAVGRTGVSAPLTIRVPEDARPGNRNVCSVVAGYNTPCARFLVGNGQPRGGTQVQGVQIERSGASSLPLIGSLPFMGSLPRTGVAIGALLLLATALVLAGVVLVARSRHRQGRPTGR